MSSIRKFRFINLIGVWEDIIVEGNGRMIAVKRHMCWDFLKREKR